MWLSASSESTHKALALEHLAGQRGGATLVELLALLDGEKNGLRLVCSAEHVGPLFEAAKTFGLAILASEEGLADVHMNSQGDRYQEWAPLSDGSTRAVYLARGEADAAHLRDLDVTGGAGLANFLGYPACCDRAYVAERRPDWWLAIAQTTSVRSGLLSVANRLSTLYSSASYLYDYFPCGFDCEESTTLARNNRERLLRHGCGPLVAAWDRHQRGVFVVSSDQVWRQVGGEDGPWALLVGESDATGLPDAGIRLEFISP
jgi:hypothetical protein